MAAPCHTPGATLLDNIYYYNIIAPIGLTSISKRIFKTPHLEREEIKEFTNNTPGVYLWYCKETNKGYVGSGINLYKRLSRYYQSTYLNQKLIKDLPIARAFKKHSMVNFNLVILDFTDKDNLHISEQRFIDELKPEYNILKKAGVRLKKVVKPLISDQQKEKLARKRGITHHSYGKARSEKDLILMRDNHPKTKKVYQYLADGTFVAKYNSLREMTKLTGVTRNYVVKCIQENKLAHNTWKFYYEPL